MGTRHLCAAVIDGDFKIAQYGQWDGYPSGQGITVLSFASTLADPAARAQFEERLRKCSWISEDEIQESWVDCGAPVGAQYVDMDIANLHSQRYPHLSRDAGGTIFGLVAAAPDGLKLEDSRTFAQDSLFCEWAWVLDLDNNLLEAYRGFNTGNPTPAGRFAYLNEGGRDAAGGSKYYPVDLIGTWPLDALPSEAEFLAYFKGKDGDEEEEEPAAVEA